MNLRFTDRVAIFEVARVYHPGEDQLPDEPRLTGILLSGPDRSPWWGDGSPGPFEFFHLKGIVETLAGRMGIEKVEFEPVDRPPYQKGRAAAVTVNGSFFGHFGELEPTLKGLFDLPEGRVVLGEFALEPLLSGKGTHVHRRFSRFPVLTQDLALECPEDVTSSRLEDVLRRAAGPLLVDLRLFDLYRGDQVGEGRRSLAYTLVFQAPDRSLTEKEISRVRDRIVRSLKKELAVDLRS
jgi:phenylalanyl-tRNA synthetase beta chain